MNSDPRISCGKFAPSTPLTARRRKIGHLSCKSAFFLQVEQAEGLVLSRRRIRIVF
jgi:hypothetical protein